MAAALGLPRERARDLATRHLLAMHPAIKGPDV
jgi:hypothetical protein